MIDAGHHISTVERRVGRRTLAAGEARTVTLSRVYDTTPDDLWDACTSAERISRWFLPISGDLRPGGRFAFEGNASGTIERCEPPHAIDATWEFGGQTSWVQVRLTPEPDAGGTRFTLEHIAHADDDIWAQYGPGAVGIGWDGGLLGLTLHLASGGAGPDRDEVAAWQASEDGRRFTTLAGERWAQADAAAGTDPDAARAAAARTIGAYTGEPAG
jgi:uncharacterized protein YndB with AHSA1/START domain